MTMAQPVYPSSQTIFFNLYSHIFFCCWSNTTSLIVLFNFLNENKSYTSFSVLAQNISSALLHLSTEKTVCTCRFTFTFETPATPLPKDLWSHNYHHVLYLKQWSLSLLPCLTNLIQSKALMKFNRAPKIRVTKLVSNVKCGHDLCLFSSVTDLYNVL